MLDLSAPRKDAERRGGGGKRIIARAVGALNRSDSAAAKLLVQRERRAARGVVQFSAESQLRLEQAAKKGDTDALHRLLHAGADVNLRLDSYDLRPLHYAAWHGRREAVEVLLAYKADINARNKDLRTALHLCSSRGHLKTARLLARRGAFLTVRDKEGKTPLDAAEIADRDSARRAGATTMDGRPAARAGGKGLNPHQDQRQREKKFLRPRGRGLREGRRRKRREQGSFRQEQKERCRGSVVGGGNELGGRAGSELSYQDPTRKVEEARPCY
eukprot:705862-Hanusia_phi.AAC.1